jgi:hypothetical protein
LAKDDLPRAEEEEKENDGETHNELTLFLGGGPGAAPFYSESKRSPSSAAVQHDAIHLFQALFLTLPILTFLGYEVSGLEARMQRSF